MNRIEATLARIQFVRKYTLTLLDATPTEEWFRMPSPPVSHVAWQVGHIATAQYGLMLAARRGPRDSDTAIIAPDFRQRFARASSAAVDASGHPSPEELRATLDRVHAAAMAEVATISEAELEGPPLIKLMVAQTKADALAFCPEHEMLHAGQIGLLRRLLGHNYIR